MEPLLPARIYPFKVARGPKTITPAGVHVFKHVSSWGHIHIQTIVAGEGTAQGTVEPPLPANREGMHSQRPLSGQSYSLRLFF